MICGLRVLLSTHPKAEEITPPSRRSETVFDKEGNPGNSELLNFRRIGYFASGRIVSTSVLPTLEWAAEVAKQEEVAVVSGFHSKLEREVLDILLKGRCGIICVLARPIYKAVPAKFREAFGQGRLLFISNNTYAFTMTSRYLCQQRNEYIASMADELVFSSVTPESTLWPLRLIDRRVIEF